MHRHTRGIYSTWRCFTSIQYNSSKEWTGGRDKKTIRKQVLLFSKLYGGVPTLNGPEFCPLETKPVSATIRASERCHHQPSHTIRRPDETYYLLL